jgi:threonine dehydrogenase-like Zn-dependent dehydrogenase
VKALCWAGVNELAVERVPDPSILNAQDAILKVLASSVCGSDLHLLDGHVPGMREGDILGHEFVGELVEIGPGVRTLSVGDRVVVASSIGCGGCWYCQHGAWSLCDNSNPNGTVAEKMWGDTPAGIFAFSHLFGGFAGSHAEYVRVPFADHNAFRVPGAIPDDMAVFASDSVPTGWLAADLCGIVGGDVVAVWGAGAVGQMAARSATLMGAGRVIVIDRFKQRLAMARTHLGVDTIDYTEVEVLDELREMTAGRGPDRCIEAVGMQAHEPGVMHAYDKVKQVFHLQTDRTASLRQAILACRKGGTVAVVGVFTGLADKVPLGAFMNKALTLRTGQQPGQHYIPHLLQRMATGEINPGYLNTHPLPLDDGPRGYDLFKNKREDCVRAVFHPAA